MRNDHYFVVHKRPRGGAKLCGQVDWLAHAVGDLPRAELEKLLECPDALLWANLDRPVKLDHAIAMVLATLELTDGPRTVAYKRNRAKNRWKAFLNLFRGSRALRSWRLGHALLARGIATPRPLVVCEPGRFNAAQPWQQRATYLATEWVEGAENLHLWAWALAERPLDERMKHAAGCARSLGTMVGRMHARGISHGDLKGSNVLVVDGSNNAGNHTLEVFLIDLDDVRIHKRLPHKRQVSDLARLATSVAGHPWAGNSLRCRFLAAYAAEFPRGAVCRKTLWRAIAKKSGKQVSKKRQRGDAVL